LAKRVREIDKANQSPFIPFSKGENKIKRLWKKY